MHVFEIVKCAKNGTSPYLQRELSKGNIVRIKKRSTIVSESSPLIGDNYNKNASDNRVPQKKSVVKNNLMQNNSDNTSNSKENYGTQLTNKNIDNLSGQNKKGFKRMTEEFDVYVNPDADRASYIPHIFRKQKRFMLLLHI